MLTTTTPLTSGAESEFFAIVAHELTVPLQAITGCIDTLTTERGGPLTADQRETLRRMRRSARHLLALIEQVAIAERAEIGECLRAVAMDIKPQALRKGLTVTVLPQPEPLHLAADVAPLRRILFHLLSSAVKYTEHGEIHVGARRADSGDVEVLVHGPGLGLAIAERLTPLLGREIAITSMPGRGTTFTLRLPTALGDARA